MVLNAMVCKRWFTKLSSVKYQSFYLVNMRLNMECQAERSAKHALYMRHARSDQSDSAESSREMLLLTARTCICRTRLPFVATPYTNMSPPSSGRLTVALSVGVEKERRVRPILKRQRLAESHTLATKSRRQPQVSSCQVEGLVLQFAQSGPIRQKVRMGLIASHSQMHPVRLLQYTYTVPLSW